MVLVKKNQLASFQEIYAAHQVGGWGGREDWNYWRHAFWLQMSV